MDFWLMILAFLISDFAFDILKQIFPVKKTRNIIMVFLFLVLILMSYFIYK